MRELTFAKTTLSTLAVRYNLDVEPDAVVHEFFFLNLDGVVQELLWGGLDVFSFSYFLNFFMLMTIGASIFVVVRSALHLVGYGNLVWYSNLVCYSKLVWYSSN